MELSPVRSTRRAATSFEEYLTLYAAEVAIFGRAKIKLADEPWNLRLGFEGPSGCVTVAISSVRAWAKVDGPLLRMGPSLRRDPLTEAEIVRKTIAALHNAALGIVLPASHY